MTTFDWLLVLKTVHRDCCDGEAISKFREASSDADRVSWCSQLPIWSDDSVRRFIQRCVKASLSKTNSKSNEMSRSWREKGNVEFKKRRYHEALLSYSRVLKLGNEYLTGHSVLTAPRNRDGGNTTDSLGMAFGNRSAALYHLNKYELAVQECDRAMNNDYPKASLHKILQRKGRCLIQMGQRDTAEIVLRQALTLMLDKEANMSEAKKESLKTEIEKLLSDCSQASVDKIITSQASKPEEISKPSDKLQSASRSVGLRICNDWGRGLVAELPVRAGELVVMETPYAVVLLPDYHGTHCHQCCRRTLNPLPCPKCPDVQYCSDQCVWSAWDSHHWLECGLWEELMTLGTEAWLSLRLLLQAQTWRNANCVAADASQQTSPIWSKHRKADPQTSSIKTTGGTEHHEDGVKTKEGTSRNTPKGQYRGLVAHASQTGSVGEETEPRSTDDISSHSSARRHFCESPHISEVDGVRLKDEVKRNNRTSPQREQGTSHNAPGKHSRGTDSQTSQTKIAREVSEPRRTKDTSTHNSVPDHLSEEPHSTVDVVRDSEFEGERNNRTSLPGCDEDGCYRSDYRAVYHLMPHTKNHSDKQLFNMTMTAVLLSKCIKEKLLCSAKWMHCYGNASSALTASCNPGCLKLGGRDLAECSKTSPCTDRSERKCDCRKPLRNQLDENFPPVVSETAAFLLRHLQQLTCNSHAVTAVQPSEDANPLSNMDRNRDETLNVDSAVNATVDTTRQVRLATAIYPTASLLNHSCDPNVIASFEGAVLTLRATRDIHPGEEILHCYGPHARHMSRDARQRALQDQYFFTCTCDACTTAPADEMAACDWSNSFACCNCSQVLVQRVGKRNVGVCTNSKCRRTQSLRDSIKEKERAGNLFKLSQHFLQQKHIEECLGILHQCYNIQRGILYKHHRALAETQDCLAQCYSRMGEFKAARKYLRLSVETVEKQYGSESIELARELQKLAQVLFNGGEVQDTLVIAGRAIKLLALHYGQNHRDVLELTEMKSCLMSL